MLWILLGYLVVTATLLVTFGRISDIFGRVKLYNVGFGIFTAASVLLAATPGSGSEAAWLILAFRIIQGIGGAFLFANSTALLTDAFPPRQRGFAMGISQVAATVGMLGGLLIGGWLSTVNWRFVLLVSVPFGLVGTIWGFLGLRETATLRAGQRVDVWGNLTFGVGLTLVLVALTYGIEPYGSSSMGWGNPWVLGSLHRGLGALGGVCPN